MLFERVSPCGGTALHALNGQGARSAKGMDLPDPWRSWCLGSSNPMRSGGRCGHKAASRNDVRHLCCSPPLLLACVTFVARTTSWRSAVPVHRRCGPTPLGDRHAVTIIIHEVKRIWGIASAKGKQLRGRAGAPRGWFGGRGRTGTCGPLAKRSEGMARIRQTPVTISRTSTAGSPLQ
jgi:hypothetical protein